MFDQPSGLRFDIYERVQLPESETGIKELDEIELIPYIQVLNQGEQAVLKGNLLLTGRYASEEEERGSQQLEHAIPVEITLPMNRIDKLEDVGVDIENFDVELISSRSLNVTGVLLLRGIVVASTDIEQWNEDEELVFTHQVEEIPIVSHIHEMDNLSSYEFQPSVALDLAAEEYGGEAVILQAEQTMAEPEPQKDLKIAFGSKKSQIKQEDKPFGLMSLIHKPTYAGQPETRGDEAEPVNNRTAAATALQVPKHQESSTGNTSADTLEWRKLFIQQDEDVQQFRKLRMCIVQKEETMDLIAQRYRLNPREIVLYNRLGDKEVYAGQIIYIPN